MICWVAFNGGMSLLNGRMFFSFVNQHHSPIFKEDFFVKHPGGVHLEISVNNAVRCSFSVNHRKEGGLIASFAYNMG